MKQKYALEALNVSKQFGELRALDKVTLQLKQNSFHALLGENGAGKSTLVKCIMGYYKPDEGEVLFGNKQEIITNPHDAMSLGIGMVYQHFTLIPNMSVAENIVLSRPSLPRVINWREEMKQLQARMQDMPFDIPLDVSVNRLAAGEKQKVEIIKQLMLDIKVLILDEPTSVLTPNEADEVLGKIRQMTQDQDLSVLIITHKFREVMNFADEVTVLRKGQFAGAAQVANVNPQLLANMMVGSEVISEPLNRNEIDAEGSQVVVSITDLHVQDDEGTDVVCGLSMDIKSGEIVGIAGVSGNGQKQLVEVLAGQRQAESGEIKLHKESYSAQREQMRKHKFYCLPEEPLRNACVANMTVADNLAFRVYDQPPFAWKNWLLNKKAFVNNAKSQIKEFSIRPPDGRLSIGSLSGGNVQRTVLARELAGDVDVLVVANPCFGLDFGAVAEVRKRIMQARNDGAAVLLVSEDLDEILELSDRFYVISNGSLVYETVPQAANLTEIGQHMAGH
ncbi:ABC transporter ATP-binding protein [Kaarinaea lacus]